MEGEVYIDKMNSSNIIKIIDENQNINNDNGSFSICNFRFFYKINSRNDFIKELKGYKKLKNSYIVPKLIYSCKNKEKGILLYEYNNNVKENKGLLVDYFAKIKELDQTYFDLLSFYKDIFMKTLKIKKNDNINVLFKDRIKNRIDVFYTKDFFEEIEAYKKISLNGIDINLNIEEIISEIKKFYKKNKNTYCVLSQCDPNDLNICEDGMIFDFLCGGYNPIMAEFATFIWYNIAQAEYLSLKYNKKSFEKHNLIYKKINKIIVDNNNNLNFKIRAIRKDAIKLYTNEVIKNIIDEAKFKDWYYEFKNYIALKILGVFNLRNMSKEDMLLSLAYLSLFYNSDFKNIDQFSNFIYKIC